MLNQAAQALIKLYQHLFSPDHSFWAVYLRPHGYCRYYPTCSNYALESFKTHSFFKALWLSLRRVFSCHPWSEGGFDEVPQGKKI